MENFVFKSKIRIALSHNCNLKCIYCDNARISDCNRIISMEDYRSTPISNGDISSLEYVKILSALLQVGFNRVNFTGGEPMLNKDWDLLVCIAKEMGFESVEMTTNATLIGSYLRQHRNFPNSLDRLIISLDTYDSIMYSQIIGSNHSLDVIVHDIKELRKANPNLKLSANCVLYKDNSINFEKYIDFVRDLGFDSVTFLDLVIRDRSKKEEVIFFQNEYTSGENVKKYIYQKYGNLPVYSERHSYNVQLPSGVTISLSDTQGKTRRDELCSSCPCYCQEGLYTIRVATDGTITDCLNPHRNAISARESIIDGSLSQKLEKFYERLENSVLDYNFHKFIDDLSGGQVGKGT